MTDRAVVDASVAARWVLNVPGREESRDFLYAYQDERLRLVAPRLQRIEVASAIWKYYRAGLIDSRTMESAYDEYQANAPLFFDTPDLARGALRLAAAHGHSVYDCSYVALSLELGCELLTADKKLVRSLGGAFPQIRLVGTGTD